MTVPSEGSKRRPVAWITGASSGIGRGLALELAKRGWVVAASARDGVALAALVKEAPRIGSIHSAPLDVTDHAAVQPALDAIERVLGPVELAIFGAGTHMPVSAASFDAEAFRRLLDVNVMGVVHGLEAVLPGFVARRRGHVAIVSSVAGYRGMPTAAAYGATKAALINMAESLKFDLDRCGVRLSLIDPGFVRTPMTERIPFKMPFLMEPEAAARRIADGLVRGGFEIAFPRRFVLWAKLLRILPYRLYFPLVRWFTGR